MKKFKAPANNMAKLIFNIDGKIIEQDRDIYELIDSVSKQILIVAVLVIVIITFLKLFLMMYFLTLCLLILIILCILLRLVL